MLYISKKLILLSIIALMLTSCNESNESEISNNSISSTTKSTEEITTKPEDITSSKTETTTNIETIIDGEYSGEIFPELVLIAQAYKTKDSSKLTDEKSLYILAQAEKIISEIITENMSNYEKEVAVHNYLILNCEYDVDEFNIFKEVSEDSSTPYGVLKNKKSICLGYTKTFQLFMNMLEIECITVHSSALSEEHAWNMVKLDDEWYHVDVTWDDPIPDYKASPYFIFLNVTDEVMEIEHDWPRESFPKATATKYNYHTVNNLVANNQNQYKQLIKSQIKSEKKIISIICTNKIDEYDVDLDYTLSNYFIWQYNIGDSKIISIIMN